ncbi:hypothetical protein FRC0431_01850 [Corynebacterium diphtheriae]|nr:hypothetical protein FRC0431_01850 [Corynebacterium diphtheriae]
MGALIGVIAGLVVTVLGFLFEQLAWCRLDVLGLEDLKQNLIFAELRALPGKHLEGRG